MFVVENPIVSAFRWKVTTAAIRAAGVTPTGSEMPRPPWRTGIVAISHVRSEMGVPSIEPRVFRRLLLLP